MSAYTWEPLWFKPFYFSGCDVTLLPYLIQVDKFMEDKHDSWYFFYSWFQGISAEYRKDRQLLCAAPSGRTLVLLELSAFSEETISMFLWNPKGLGFVRLSWAEQAKVKGVDPRCAAWRETCHLERKRHRGGPATLASQSRTSLLVIVMVLLVFPVC